MAVWTVRQAAEAEFGLPCHHLPFDMLDLISSLQELFP